MSKRYTPYGYGDPETWPPYSGNHNDPRAPEPPDDYDFEDDENNDDDETPEDLPDDDR